MQPVFVGLHIPQKLASTYMSAIGAKGRTFWLGGLSASYDEQTGLAARYSTLEQFLRAEVPEWSPGAPLVLVCWSAGCFAARAWMRHLEDRKLVRVLVLLDGLHSKLVSGKCSRGPVDGIVAYARNALGNPKTMALAVTASSIVPPGYASTGSCTRLVDSLVSGGPSLLFKYYGGEDAAAHVEQVNVVGPELMRGWVRDQLSGSALLWSNLKWGALFAAAGIGGAWLYLRGGFR